MSKGTRILNISPKAQLAIDDSKSAAYPTILRTGDERTLGNDPVLFDDFETQVFVSQNVEMPYNVGKAWVKNLGYSTGTISFDKTPTPASQFLTKYTDTSYSPFIETRNPSAFYESGSSEYTGFDETLYQGFTSPTTSKVAIPININVNSSKTIKIEGDKAQGTTSPFVYYNFEDKTWDQIGVKDPSTEAYLGYVHALQGGYASGGGITYITASSGNATVVKQFTSSPGIASKLSIFDLKTTGYDKIGYPTTFFEAPDAPRYHARDSQTLKMSDYIQHPFVLEKIEVQLPIQATRKQGTTGGLTPLVTGFGRDIENHVFFIYRQNRASLVKDSVQDVSSSVRSLIANESFCFYNRPTMPLSISIIRSTPIHENQLEYNFNMSSTDVDTVTSKPIMLNMKFTPKTYEQQITAPSTNIHVVDKGGPNETWTTGYHMNYWGGGQKNQPYNFSLYSVPTAPEYIRTIQTRGYNTPTFAEYLGINYPDGVHLENDPRTLRSSTFASSIKDPVDNSAYFDVDVTTKDLGYRANLYILQPEDELIFGIDAGFFATYTADPSVTTSGSPPDLPTGYLDTITGASTVGGGGDTMSTLVLSKGDAKVILYGSLIKDGVEVMSSLNQKLRSPAVHEDIHQVVTDQFQINESSLYSGSYFGNYITGSITSLTSPRGLVSDAASGQSYPYLTLNRNVTLTNFTAVLSNSVGGLLSGINSSRLTTKYPTANFRYDKFGQFRDMLEQRRDSKYTEDVVIVPNFPLLTFDKVFGKSYISSPVLVTFTSKSSDIPVSPIDTTSCNLSSECTSSLPYFDGESPRNRTPIVFTKNPAFSVETIILDKPSSLLSST